MKLKTRLIISYTVLALFAVIALSVVYQHYMEQQLCQDVYDRVRETSKQMINSFDLLQSQMEQEALILLSNQDVLTAIRSLSEKMADQDANRTEVNESASVIRHNVNTAYNQDQFYRVLLFNRYGFIASSSNSRERLVNQKTRAENIPWLPRVQNAGGDMVLVGIHRDDWSEPKNARQVYSVVKEIQGNQLGFIEIQILASDFEAMLQGHEENALILAREDGSLLYSSRQINVPDYDRCLRQADNTITEWKNPRTGLRELIMADTSEMTGVRFLLIQNWGDKAGALTLISRP